MKMLASLVLVGIVLFGIGAGTWAYFYDIETSSDNIFSAGTLDLLVSNDGVNYIDEWSGPIATFSNMAPGKESGDIMLCLKNNGTIAGIVTVQMSYSEYDAAEYGEYAGINVDADTFAKNLFIVYANTDGVGNVSPWWAQQIIDEVYSGDATAAVNDGAVIPSSGPTGYMPTLYGMSKITLHYWHSYSDQTDIPFQPGDSHCTVMRVMLNPDAGNNFQFDGVSVTITAHMDQYTG